MAKVSRAMGKIAEGDVCGYYYRFYRVALPRRRGVGFIWAERGAPLAPNGPASHAEPRFLVQVTCRPDGIMEGITDSKALELAMGTIEGLDARRCRLQLKRGLDELLRQKRRQDIIRRQGVASLKVDKGLRIAFEQRRFEILQRMGEDCLPKPPTHEELVRRNTFVMAYLVACAQMRLEIEKRYGLSKAA